MIAIWIMLTGKENGKAYVKPVDRFTPARKAETVQVISIELEGREGP